MPDLKTQQFALPFDDDAPVVKPYVKQHFKITFSKQMKVSIYSKRIMARVLAEIKEDDMELKPYYRFHVSEIEDSPGTYHKIKKAFDELTDLKWLIEDLEQEKFAYRHLLDTANDVDCGYEKGMVTIVLNKKLTKYFVELAHYTKYQLGAYMGLKSWYSMRLYELLSAYKDTGEWFVSIDEYRRLMDCEDKYSKIPDMIERTTSEPLEELADTPLAFSLTKVAPKIVGQKGRPAIVGLHFKLLKVKPKRLKIKDWYKNPKLKQRLDALARYQVEQTHVVNYAAALGVSGIDDLLNAWRMKNESDEPIRNRKLYCNKVFCAAGRKALGQK